MKGKINHPSEKWASIYFLRAWTVLGTWWHHKSGEQDIYNSIKNSYANYLYEWHMVQHEK